MWLEFQGSWDEVHDERFNATMLCTEGKYLGFLPFPLGQNSVHFIRIRYVNNQTFTKYYGIRVIRIYRTRAIKFILRFSVNESKEAYRRRRNHGWRRQEKILSSYLLAKTVSIFLYFGINYQTILVKIMSKTFYEKENRKSMVPVRACLCLTDK